jgi:signal transduction histidine kinase
MRPPRSLSSRLIVYWIVGSALAYFSLPVAIRISFAALGLGEFRDENLESWTTKRARYIVQAALREGPDGRKFIEPTDELRGYMRRNPEFRFAAIDVETGAVLPGSSEELATAFAPSTRVDMLTISFHMADDPNPNARGWVRTIGTAIGDMRFVLYGAYFRSEDLFYNLSYTLTIRNFFVYLPFCGVLTLIAFVVVRRGLAPLRAAAGAAASIDVNSLKERIPSADLPSEIAPFVEAVNHALARVDDGVARQRRFLANAAHELRTPITILCAHIANPDDATFRRDVKRDARRIRTIVEQLLSMAHVDNQKGGVESETDLGNVALSVILSYMPLTIENGRNIELEQPSAPVIVRADRWAVESILTNLIENAVRAEPKGGAVLVRVHGDARIDVVDHGDGVALEDRDAIFEPFWRKSDATRGAGLGLAVAKELMDKLDGRIWVEETSGGGATFKLSFRSERAFVAQSPSANAVL